MDNGNSPSPAPMHNGGAPGRTYDMVPGLDLRERRRFQDYMRQHEEQQRRDRENERRANADAMRQFRASPVYDEDEPVSVGRPAARPRPRPASRPAEEADLREFKDDFADAVKAYLKAHSKGGGEVFVIADASGKRHWLKYSGVDGNDIRNLSRDEVVGKVDFESARGPAEKLSLDFYLSNEDAGWEVKKFAMRGAGSRPNEAASSGRAPTQAPAQAAAGPRTFPKPTAPAHLSAGVTFTDPSGENRLYGGDAGRLTVKVSNAGPGAAYGVRLKLEPQGSVDGLNVPAAVEFGDLAAGKSVEKTAVLAAADTLADGNAKILLTITEGNGFDTQPVLVEFETRAYRAPKLELADLRVAGGGAINAGEPAKLQVVVRNAGLGRAANATAALELGSKDIFMSGEPSVALGALEPGAAKTVEFEFFVNRRVKSGQALPISLALKDAATATSRPLGLVLGKGAPQVQVVSVKGAAEAAAAARGEDVDAPPKSTAKLDPNAFAVVVGIEKYRDVAGADFAARDAEVVRSYLTRSMGFDERNVILLENERATLTDLTTYLGPWLKDHADKKSRVFIYYSGHGAPDPTTGRAYLIPYDGDPAYPETKAFALSRLYDTLAKLPTDDVTVVLDSCFSGAGGRSLLAQGTRPLVNMRVDAAPANTVLLAASGPDQISTFDPDSRHGLLTYFLLKGLSGAADVKGDGRITTRELYDYVRPSVERQARLRHVEQSPVLSPSPEALGRRAERVWVKR